MYIDKDGYRSGRMSVRSGLGPNTAQTAGASALAAGATAAYFSAAITSATLTSGVNSFANGFVTGGAGFVGLGVDVASGAMLSHWPGALDVVLVPEGEDIHPRFASLGVMPHDLDAALEALEHADARAADARRTALIRDRFGPPSQFQEVNRARARVIDREMAAEARAETEAGAGAARPAADKAAAAPAALPQAG